MDNIRAIHNDDDLAWAIAEIERYFDREPEPGSADADRFEILSVLIEAYEDKIYPIEAPDPVEFLKAHMALSNRSQSDLARLFASPSRASEVLNRKRPLTLDMVHRLHTEWGLPAQNLIEPYHLKDSNRQRA